MDNVKKKIYCYSNIRRGKKFSKDTFSNLNITSENIVE